MPERFEDGTPGFIHVCGDTHGQFYDTMAMWERYGFPSRTCPYAFNGGGRRRRRAPRHVRGVITCGMIDAAE